ncbi:hypothetical protein Trydic_g9662 [Trypoxylus dichotomus]
MQASRIIALVLCTQVNCSLKTEKIGQSNMHEEAKYQCHKCTKIYTRKNSLYLHVGYFCGKELNSLVQYLRAYIKGNLSNASNNT